VEILNKIKSRITGTTPQTNGNKLGEWREGCGYNVKCKYDVVYSSGIYTGTDTEWGNVGIPYSVLDKINRECPDKFGWRFEVSNDIKYAIISFDNREYAFWFNLQYSKQ